MAGKSPAMVRTWRLAGWPRWRRGISGAPLCGIAILLLRRKGCRDDAGRVPRVRRRAAQGEEPPWAVDRGERPDRARGEGAFP